MLFVLFSFAAGVAVSHSRRPPNELPDTIHAPPYHYDAWDGQILA